MNPARRRWLLALGQAPLAPLGGLGAPVRAHAQAQAGQPPRSGAGADGGETDPVRRGREWVFPRDHGAHLGARVEWWYATGWLGSEDAPHLGFQLTFFRSRTALAESNPSRFAPRQLLMAHAALVDLRAGRHAHDQRIVRWSGAADAGGGRASVSDAHIEIGNWWLRRDAAQWRASLPAAGFDLQLSLKPSQPLLLQGDAGFSRKGPGPEQASHYYSEPQLRAAATWAPGRAAQPAQGRAWLDHEWSDQILHPQAVGWDWAGINLFDGSALTVFALRRADGSALWSGGSFRAPGAAARSFSDTELRLTAGRRWRSPRTHANYPVQWQVETPAGNFELRALLDAQELDSRASTGTVYWEGLSELLDAKGRRVGLGYLEMTGYAGALRLG